MIYVFCLSYLSIPVVLTITHGQEEFKIITDQKPIADFFKTIFSEEKVMLIERPPEAGGIGKLLLPLKLNKYKQELLEKLGRPKNAVIYFFYNAFGYHVSWWLNQVADGNTIYYKPDIDMSMWETRYTLKSIAKQFWIRVNFSALTIPVWGGSKFFYKVSDSYIKKNKINLLADIPVEVDFIKALLDEKFHIGNKKYMLLVGNTVSDNMVSEEEYTKKNDELISLLKPENVAIKMHPRFNFLYSLEKECHIIPSIVPANIIFGNFEVIIGYSSAALFEAANSGKKAISLVNIFNAISEDTKVNYINYLKGNLLTGATIFFPATVEEVKEILG